MYATFKALPSCVSGLPASLLASLVDARSHGKPVAEGAAQQNPIPEEKSQQPIPAGLTSSALAGLKAAAPARRGKLIAAK
jgi:hypothetical protein